MRNSAVHRSTAQPGEGGSSDQRLAFCELTEDHGQEGCFPLHRLPTAEEAEVIRDIIGIRKRIEWAPGLAVQQERARRLSDRGDPRELGPTCTKGG